MEQFFKIKILFSENLLNQIHIFAGEWLDYFMYFITVLGYEIFYLLFIPVLYWTYDKRKAILIGSAFIISSAINVILKDLFQNPRPDPANLIEGIKQLNQKYLPHSHGFPSGHSQHAIVFWGSIAYFIKNKYIRFVCISLILLIPYTRLYLAVHFPGDVFGGLVIGGIFLYLFIIISSRIEKEQEKISNKLLLFMFFIFPFIIFLSISGNYMPRIMGVLSGFAIGAIILNEKIDFNPVNRALPNTIKIILGVTGLFIIRSLLKIILPQIPFSDYIRYWLLGFWISLIAPFLFSKIILLKGTKSV